jgi:hypothetical protein
VCYSVIRNILDSKSCRTPNKAQISFSSLFHCALVAKMQMIMFDEHLRTRPSAFKNNIKFKLRFESLTVCHLQVRHQVGIRLPASRIDVPLCGGGCTLTGRKILCVDWSARERESNIIFIRRVCAVTEILQTSLIHMKYVYKMGEMYANIKISAQFMQYTDIAKYLLSPPTKVIFSLVVGKY